MPTIPPFHQQIAEGTEERVLELISTSRCCNRLCLRAFLERCQREAFMSPKKAIPLCLQAPEYVERVFDAESPDYGNHLVWAYGILGSCLSESGSQQVAEQVFATGRAVSPADRLERAAFNSRFAYHRARYDWREGYDLITRVVDEFREDQGQIREDRSLPTVLTVRGIIQGYAYMLGEVAAPHEACQDFREAAELAPVCLPRTRLVAVSGFLKTVAQLWLSMRSPSYATPRSVIAEICQLRRKLRREKVPHDSVVDAKCRWILGMATHKLVGGLSTQAEWFLRGSRAVIVEFGSPFDVVALTLDFQWCLVGDGRWADALAEFDFIAERIKEMPPEWHLALQLWHENLKAETVNEGVVRDVFRKIRGIRQVVIPGQEDDTDEFALIGW